MMEEIVIIIKCKRSGEYFDKKKINFGVEGDVMDENLGINV